LRKDDLILSVDGRLTTPQQFLVHLRAKRKRNRFASALLRGCIVSETCDR
jgi:hypothetical protein